MKANLTTSVALCSYNGEKFIEEQIRSILNQTMKIQEIIVVDDCSNDNTVRIAEAILENTDIKWLVLKNDTNIGFVKNFEKAMKLCTNDIIFLSDQDDIWYEDKVECILQYFHDNIKIAGLTHDAKIVDADRVWYGTYKNVQFRNGYGHPRPPITGALSVIKREYLAFIFPIPKVSGHDIWIDYTMSFFKNYWLFVDDCLGEIRRHHNNTSEWFVNSFQSINKIDVLSHQFLSKIAKSYHDRFIINSALRQRLKKNNYFQEIFDAESALEAIEKLNAERFAIASRQKIVRNRKRVFRWYYSLRLLFAGGYNYFNGVKSFSRDIFR